MHLKTPLIRPFSLLLLLCCLLPQSSQAERFLTVKQVSRLIQQAEPNVEEYRYWAKELLSVLKGHQFARNTKNVCAVIAVIDQESGFKKNPPVAGLGRLAKIAVNDKLDGLAFGGSSVKKWLQTHPNKKNNYMRQMGKARTERDLDRVYQQIVASMFFIKTLAHINIIRDLIENNNNINTIGSMQVSSRFAIQTEEQWRGRKLTLDEIWKLREWMYSVRGGMHYGTLLLLGYKAGYQQKIHHFADYNAGRYASRNAAFQSTLAKLSGKKISTDGDLLKYGRNQRPIFAKSNSEKIILSVVKKYKLSLRPSQIRKDFTTEKTAKFSRTKTYRLIRKLYRNKKGKRPPLAIIPTIRLNSKKVSRVLTTKIFASNVYRRYDRCMKRAPR